MMSRSAFKKCAPFTKVELVQNFNQTGDLSKILRNDELEPRVETRFAFLTYFDDGSICFGPRVVFFLCLSAGPKRRISSLELSLPV
jgi:hypothetical protein